MTSQLFEKHRPLLDAARKAAAERGYWSAFNEAPEAAVYGENARVNADREFVSLQGKAFELPGHPALHLVGSERSPLGETIGVSYPTAGADVLFAASRQAGRQWGRVSIDERTGICLEMIERLNHCSHLIARCCQATTGQPLLMAFQSGGPHAQERALEAVAYAYEEMARIPAVSRWEKPQPRGGVARVDKTFTIIPRGVAVAIGCGTFPTWNSYAGIFASLATGNTVIIKPHPSSILPLAITARILREVLTEQRLDPNTVLLAADTTDAPATKELVMHPQCAIVDFTGSSAFGSWLRAHVRHALLYTEEAGVNSIVIDSTDDFRGMCQNIAISLSLYSGQMCTTPQNLLIPRGGIDSNEGHKTFAEVIDAIRSSIVRLLDEPARAEAILGAIQSEETLARMTQATIVGVPVLSSSPVQYRNYPGARTCTPLIQRVDAAEREVYSRESFGPISYAVSTESSAHSIQLAQELAESKGAITFGLYSTNAELISQAQQASLHAGVTLSCNFTGSVLMNQNAAFSDYHVTGANPAGNACLTDSAFVASRFRVVAMRSFSTAGQTMQRA